MRNKARFVFKRLEEEVITSKKTGKSYNKAIVVCDKKGQLDPYETKTIVFTAFGSGVDDIKTIFVENGHEVEVEYRVKCREWNGKYFTELELVKLTSLGPFRGVSSGGTDEHWSDTGTGQKAEEQQEPDTFSSDQKEDTVEDDPFADGGGDENDDLPF